MTDTHLLDAVALSTPWNPGRMCEVIARGGFANSVIAALILRSHLITSVLGLGHRVAQRLLLLPEVI